MNTSKSWKSPWTAKHWLLSEQTGLCQCAFLCQAHGPNWVSCGFAGMQVVASDSNLQKVSQHGELGGFQFFCVHSLLPAATKAKSKMPLVLETQQLKDRSGREESGTKQGSGTEHCVLPSVLSGCVTGPGRWLSQWAQQGLLIHKGGLRWFCKGQGTTSGHLVYAGAVD